MIGRRTVLLLALLALACGRKSSRSTDAANGKDGVVALNGAGATFPFPLYSKWTAEYNRLYPNVRINYQSIGSGGGIRQIVAQTVDFGASDAAMQPSEAAGAPGKITHIPTVIGSVVVTYNLEGVNAPLKLTPEALAGIFLGEVKKWNDPRIAEHNPGVPLPDKDIAVVYRSDGSGTTAVFTEYLSTVSPAWKEKVGTGKSVKWPVGLGAKGNEGIAGQVKTTPGTIGYVELAYATQTKLPKAAIRNKAGKFVEPSPEAATAAAEGVELPDTLHASLVDASGENAYPIAAYTYILVYEDMKNPEKAQTLVRFLWWAVHDGQKFAKDLDYAPLPPQVVTQIEAKLKTLTAGGKPAFGGV